jgi:acetyl esterase
MPLDPQVVTLLEQLERAGAQPFYQLTPQEARDQMLLGSRFLGPSAAVESMQDYQVPGEGVAIPVRLYRPSSEPELPVLVYFHGGGWIMGSIETHEGLSRSLCNQANVCVVSVEYRLAPEHKFPAGLNDCFAVTKWVTEHAGDLDLDGTRIAVGGDSAGGNLAAAVCLMARDSGGPQLRYQVLLYPVLDFDFSRPSYLENGEGFHLTRQDMVSSWGHYLACELDGYSPLAAPLRADHLADLPAALIATAQYDPLHDEGAEYANRLAAAGVPVTYQDYEGMIHGFARRTNQLDRSRTAIKEIAEHLRAALED